jgi:phage shock protein C
MKKLFRIKNQDSLLGGVVLGLTEYIGVDVTVLRILTVAAFFSPVPIVIMYVIAWAIMPMRTETPYLQTASTISGTSY